MLTTPWISRLAALLLLGVVLAAGYGFILAPVVAAYADTAQAIADARDRLAHYQRLAAMRPALARQMTEIEKRQAPQGYYLSGSTDALAAAELQDHLNQVIAAHGGTGRSLQPLSGEDEHGFRRVTVRVQLTATMDSLFHIVYALEASTPLLFIENISIQDPARLPIAEDDDWSASPPQETMLSVGFDLYGYQPVEVR
jgi:general secretion pathway protein M